MPRRPADRQASAAVAKKAWPCHIAEPGVKGYGLVAGCQELPQCRIHRRGAGFIV